MKKLWKYTKYYLVFSGVILVGLFIYLGIKSDPKKEGMKLPEYKVLETIDRSKFGDGVWADVLVESLSNSNSKEEKSKIALQIAKIKNFSKVNLYCSELAKKANYSSKIAKKYPKEIAKCYLGSFKRN
jgi:hypothetical protein